MHRSAGTKHSTVVAITLAAMSNMAFSVGDKVTRVNDGKIGVVTAVGPTDVSVRWEPSGVVQMVMPTMLRPAGRTAAAGRGVAPASPETRFCARAGLPGEASR